MTVADSIERKQIMKKKTQYLNRMKEELGKEEKRVETANNRLNSDLELHLKNVLPENPTVQQVNDFSINFTNRHGWDLLDPVNIQQRIDKLAMEIAVFNDNVNSATSTSNSITNIEILFDNKEN